MRDPWTPPRPTQASVHRPLLKKTPSLQHLLDDYSKSHTTLTIPTTLIYRPRAPIASCRQRRQAFQSAPSGVKVCPPVSCLTLNKDIRLVGDGPQVGLVSPQPSFTSHCIIAAVASQPGLSYRDVRDGRPVVAQLIASRTHAVPEIFRVDYEGVGPSPNDALHLNVPQSPSQRTQSRYHHVT